MTELNAVLRELELQERVAWHRERAHRERDGVVVRTSPRRWRRAA